MADAPCSMYDYYEEQSILPTYGALLTEADLTAHERHRERLFTDKLHLPPRMFAGTRLLEFGPDAGENSLVFARWRADCILAEPHLKAHEVIRDYFARFDLADRLVALESHDLQTYPDPQGTEEQFDVVDAEGFIYTIQPSSVWVDKLTRLVRADGFVVLFYVEFYGALLELTWKVVQARFREVTQLESVESARKLFAAKWGSIPHKRSIESWAMDVLENPFVRLRYFFDPKNLCAEMSAARFRLYSSWPRYDGGLDVHWFKHAPTAEEELDHQLDFIARSRLSHMFGRRHFLADLDAIPETTLRSLLEDVDSLVDGFDTDRVERCDVRLSELAEVLESPAVIARTEDTRRSRETVVMLRRLLEVLADGTPERIVAFSNSDEAFVESWGMPAHFAVFRRAG